MLTSPFGCDDELGSLLLLMQLDGIGPAVGSAVLTAFDPCTYAVIDVNSAAAVQTAGYPAGANLDDPRSWLAFLCAVRGIARRCGTTLRDTDRALFIAAKNVIAQQHATK